ncbi:hypothetical protein Tco_0242297 [Tanacetum coccineum]
MANLDFCDKHNMVSYLHKSEGSEGFHQIIDFLSTSHIKYALTESLTIHVSLIEQFWQIASTSIPENGEMEITAAIDEKVKVVFEASIRRHLKLEDSNGISTLPNAKIFKQLVLMGDMRRASKGYTGVNTPLFQTMLIQGQMVQGEGSTMPVESHHTPTSAPSTSQPLTSSPSMQTTHAVSMPHDSPIPRVHSLGSDEGSLTLNELTKLEKTVKISQARRRAKIVVSNDEEDEEDSSKQGRSMIKDIDLDAGISLVPPHVADQGRIRRGVENVHTYTRRRILSTGSGLVSTTGMAGVSTGSGLDDILARVAADEGLVQQLQQLEDKRLKRAGQEGLEEPAKRQKIGEASGSVQEQSDEEPKADELSQEQLQQLMIIVPEEGMNVEALQTKYPIIDWEVYSEDTIKFWKIIRVGNYTEVYQVFEDMLKNFDRDDLVKLWSLVHERFNSTELTDDKAKELWVELKRLFEPDENDTLWKIQRYMHDPLTWKLYDTCGVHHVSTERGHDIFMLVEKDYPLTRALMTLMMCNKLRVDEYSEMENDLLRHMDNVKMPFEDRKFNKGNRESQRFVIAMKLNKGLKDSNLNHECCILEATRGTCQLNKMMLERLTQQTVDPLAAKNRGAQGNNAVGCARGRELQLPRYATIARNCTQPKRLQNSEYFKDKMTNAIDEDVDEEPVQDLALNVDNVFQADDCDAYDSDIDEAPTAQTMFMANLSSTDPVCDKAGPSYDLDILSELRVGRGAFDSNMTSYDQYVRISQCPVDKTILYYESEAHPSERVTFINAELASSYKETSFHTGMTISLYPWGWGGGVFIETQARGEQKISLTVGGGRERGSERFSGTTRERGRKRIEKRNMMVRG